MVGAGGTTVHVAPGTYEGDVVTTATGTPTARVRFISDQKWAAKRSLVMAVPWGLG